MRVEACKEDINKECICGLFLLVVLFYKVGTHNSRSALHNYTLRNVYSPQTVIII